jgi:hypothetical protein
VVDRFDQKSEVAFVDAGDGVAEANECLAGEAGGEPAHPLLPA